MEFSNVVSNYAPHKKERKMKLEKKRTWLKSENVKNGDTLTILNEGEIVTSSKFTYANGEPKKDFVLLVSHNGAEADFTVNATNKKTLIASFGDETKNWMGKVVKVGVANVMIGGATKKSIMVEGSVDTKNTSYEA